MLQHFISQFSFNYLATGHLQEANLSIRKFQIFNSKSGCDHLLQEVVAYKRFQYRDLTWKILISWKTGC